MEIFVGNLPFDVTEQEIREKFAEIGEVSNVKMLFDKLSGRFRGIAFVTFEDDSQARLAVEKLNGEDFGGRPLRLDISRGIEHRFNGFGGGFAPKKKFFKNNNRNFFRANDNRENNDFQESSNTDGDLGEGAHKREDYPRKPFFKKRPFRPFGGGFKKRDNFSNSNSFEENQEGENSNSEFDNNRNFRDNRGGFKPKFGGFKSGFKQRRNFKERGDFKGRGDFREDSRQRNFRHRNFRNNDYEGGQGFRSRDDFGDE